MAAVNAAAFFEPFYVKYDILLSPFIWYDDINRSREVYNV